MQRLGLVYGAIDLRRRSDGRDVFLEVNPAGEWRFVEERTAQSTAEEMATLLADLDRC
jgi:glutathione synthase/RimK-type ligase-like ATP-grasp enzyme